MRTKGSKKKSKRLNGRRTILLAPDPLEDARRKRSEIDEEIGRLEEEDEENDPELVKARKKYTGQYFGDRQDGIIRMREIIRLNHFVADRIVPSEKGFAVTVGEHVKTDRTNNLICMLEPLGRGGQRKWNEQVRSMKNAFVDFIKHEARMARKGKKK
ncbi:unnamed protein product [marine sediment metagenome]|uniref:Uncharacterized protein n=1 Tax=marine sediment metagenome TaxID=412755 RepID=X0WSP5_9ZZZZ